jgi:hypothetical protein
MQSASGKLPPHGLPLGHVVLVVMLRQPLASMAQVTSLPLLHTLPAPARHSGGAAGQRHMAEGDVPMQDFPVGQVMVALIPMQPLVSKPQVSKVVVPMQTLPVPPAQGTGVAGHSHDAFGAVPWQTSPAAQDSTLVTARQPLESRSQVASWPFARHSVPARPLHSTGAPVHEQLADGAAPVQGFPVGQVTRLVMSRQPSALGPQLATVAVVSQVVPACPPHRTGADGQVQAALGKDPPHGLPVVQVSDDFS